MPRPEDHQANLVAALIDATTSDVAPPFMTPDKEAIALVQIMRTVEAALRSGYCPLIKLMALSQQAIRCGAMGLTQDDERDSLVNVLLSKTVPSA